MTSDNPTKNQIEQVANALRAEGINVVLLTEQSPQQCDLCGKVAELRPYGPNGESVCFECGMKDEPAARRAFEKRLNGNRE